MANIKDVASVAGVSVATVSRYFSSPDKLSKKSTVKVEQAIKQLNYTPNLLARNFAKSRSSSILVVAPLINTFFFEVIQGIQEIAKTQGYTVLLADAIDTKADSGDYYSMLETRLVDGIIDFNASAQNAKSNREGQNNVVTLCDYVENNASPIISIDDIKSAEMVVDYLISLGHKQIGCLSGLSFVNSTRHRIQGYKNALNKADIEYLSKYIINGDYSLNCGLEAAKEFASMFPRPTAIFSMSDEMAIGLIQGLKAEGLRIPEDISVVGFDDISFARYCDPPLTTIRQPAKELGSRAMSLLCNMIEGDYDEETLLTPNFLPTDLIVRASTAPLKSP